LSQGSNLLLGLFCIDSTLQKSPKASTTLPNEKPFWSIQDQGNFALSKVVFLSKLLR